MAEPSKKNPTTFLNALKDPNSKIGDKYRAIFELKCLGTDEAIDCLIEGFPSLHPSELLKHEVTYALGQMKPNERMVKFLAQRLEDEEEQVVVRHESGEALANFGRDDARDILLKYEKYAHQEIEDTCNLGLNKLKNYAEQKSLYGLKYAGTQEPAAPFSKIELEAELSSAKLNSENLLKSVEEYILSPEIDIFRKYRAIYFLREQGSQGAVEVLADLLRPEFRDKTRVLLRHEVCFIFGQMAESAVAAKEILKQTIEDQTENEIVRHEAISGYSSMTDDNDVLKRFAVDESRIVRESCLVALDMIEYWKSGKLN